jgi:hypothetical protein
MDRSAAQKCAALRQTSGCSNGRSSAPRYLASVQRRFVILIASSLGAGLFGAAVSAIPYPSSTTLFWVGNFSAPWAVLPFIAGWAQRSWKTAALAGLLADLACVVGFYANFLTLDPRQLWPARVNATHDVAMDDCQPLDPARSAMALAGSSCRNVVRADRRLVGSIAGTPGRGSAGCPLLRRAVDLAGLHRLLPRPAGRLGLRDPRRSGGFSSGSARSEGGWPSPHSRQGREFKNIRILP